MNKRVTALVEEARKLSHEERLDLLELLKVEFAEDTAAEGTPEEIEAAWIEECQRRIERHERGETQSVSFDEVFARIRVRLARK